MEHGAGLPEGHPGQVREVLPGADGLYLRLSRRAESQQRDSESNHQSKLTAKTPTDWELVFDLLCVPRKGASPPSLFIGFFRNGVGRAVSILSWLVK